MRRPSHTLTDHQALGCELKRAHRALTAFVAAGSRHDPMTKLALDLIATLSAARSALDDEACRLADPKDRSAVAIHFGAIR